MDYTDFTIRSRDWENGQFKIEVTKSPIDQMREPEVVKFNEAELTRPLRDLEQKRIRLKDLIPLGASLGELLLPSKIREMLLNSLANVGLENGIRLRLVLNDPRIANLPWEYVYLPLATEDKEGRYGFIALNPRISIVRHEAIPMEPGKVEAAKPFKMVVGLSSPKDVMLLDLQTERKFIEQALADVKGLEVEFVENLTVEKLESACQGAHIFHYAGHGGFDFESNGGGVLILEDDSGHHIKYPAEKLAMTLRGAGVRVVVMGACETGRRDGVNVWNGVAPALMRYGIPGAVAMQYEVYDDSALAFSRRFYESLASGLSLDEAVIAGRLGILNLTEQIELDWGVPVLYMRSPDGIIFPEVKFDPSLESARDKLSVDVRQRVEKLKGKMEGIIIKGKTKNGEYKANQEATIVEKDGSITGVQIDELG